MFLSRLILNPQSREVRRDLADCQELHRTVLTAFPAVERGAGARGRVLHRLDVQPRTGATMLLVQSQVRPDWSRLPPGYLLTTPDTPKDLAAAYSTITPGIRLRFRLRANATEKVGTAMKAERLGGVTRNGRRRPLPEHRIVDWLDRKASAAGFHVLDVYGRTDERVPDVRVVRGASLTGWRRSADGVRRRLSFAPVTFDGLLEVTDADAFRRALAEGIGPAKAYGFGLLSVAPML